MTQPWYPFYWSDYSGKTMHLTMGQHGAYMLLLRWIYTTGRPIPDKQSYSIARATLEQERSDVDFVLSEFFTLTDGFWSNDRAMAVIKEQEIKHQRRVIAGKKGGEAKSSNAKAIPEQSSSNQNQNQNRDNTDVLSHASDPAALPAKSKPIYPDAFEQLWSIWPRREGKREALKAYQHATKRGTHDEITSGCTAIANAHRDCTTPDRFIPHLATWLNRDGWHDDPAAIRSRHDAAGDAAHQRRGAGATAMVAGHAVLQDIREGRTRY